MRAEEEATQSEAPQSVGWGKKKIAYALIIGIVAGSAAVLACRGVSTDTHSAAVHAGVEGTLNEADGIPAWFIKVITKDGKCSSDSDNHKFCQEASGKTIRPGYCDTHEGRKNCLKEHWAHGVNEADEYDWRRLQQTGADGISISGVIQEEEVPAWFLARVVQDPEGQCKGEADAFKFCIRTGSYNIPGNCNLAGTKCRDEITTFRRLGSENGISIPEVIQEQAIPAWLPKIISKDGGCNGIENRYQYCLKDGVLPGKCNLDGDACRTGVSRF